MSTKDPAAPPEDSGSGARLVIRIVLIAVLIVAGVAFFVDRQARTQSEEIYEKLAALEKAPDFKDKIISQQDIHTLVDRKPDGDPEAVAGHVDQMVETYTWQAGLPWNNYKIRVYYTKGETGSDETAKKVSLRYSTVTQNDDLSTPDPERPVAAPVDPPPGTPKMLPPGRPPAGETPPAEKPAETPAETPAEKG